MAKKILFVDDDKDWRSIPPEILRESGYEVLTAGDGTEALQLSESVKLDLIILDLNLAGESGLTLMKFLRRNQPAVPIILYTGMELEEAKIQAMLNEGAHKFLVKGRMGELVQEVKNVIGEATKA